MAIPLSRNSESGVADWLMKAVTPHAANEETKNTVQVKTDKDMVEAKSKVEKAAAGGKQVFIDTAMTESQKSEIKEYAQACGMKTSDVIQISDAERKAASLKQEVAAPKVVEFKGPFDPTKGFAPESAFAKRPMQQKAQGAPKTTEQGRSGGSVGRVGGIETPEAQRNIGVRQGENSIVAPDNIQKAAESKEKSNRDIIREQNKARQEKVGFDKKQWEKDITDTLPKGVRAEGSVKQTGGGTAQTHGKVGPGQHSMFDTKDENQAMPEKTAGEKLSQKNEDRKASIQRPKQDEDKGWNKPQSSKKPVVSDLLFEELKKRMGTPKNG
jgi:hypothetical protein